VPGRTVTLSGTVTSLTTAHGIERVDIDEAFPGDIVALAGIPDVTIGDTITDPADPRPMQRLDLDAPTLSMTFGANTSPLSGREGRYVTSRHIKQRLEKEVLGNVSIQFQPTDSADTFEVLGRGELQLAILIEQMRREGYEVQVSRPEVILRTVDGETHEPYERITVDIPPEFIGSVQAALADRQGRLEQMSTDADGRVRMEYVIPVRGLIGFRGQLLTETRGTALMHQIGEGYGPWAGEVTHRTSGVLVADRQGTSNGYALYSLQERSELFIGSGVDVYEGMIIGENARPEDMDVNATKEKKLTNMRTHSHDEAIRLTPPRELTLESAIEFIGTDELVEVTPKSIRLRKRVLSQHDRRRIAGREYDRAMAVGARRAVVATPGARSNTPPGAAGEPRRTIAAMPIYLDHAATTPLRREALEAMLPYLTENFGNASSPHGFGRRGPRRARRGSRAGCAARSAPSRARSSSPRAAASRTTWRSRERPGRARRAATGS
jgi:GTP-binding protein